MSKTHNPLILNGEPCEARTRDHLIKRDRIGLPVYRRNHLNSSDKNEILEMPSIP
jgi:hypothetical protein